MAKYPQEPEEIFEDYVNSWYDAFGEHVQSVVVYGSAARGDYLPGKSDINFLIVLSEAGLADLQKAIPIVENWRSRAAAVPLVVSEKYIQESLDSFPVEFLTLKLHHRCLFGKDPLADIEIAPKHVRLQLEREFKGKLLHLRAAMLAFAGKRDTLLDLMQHSLRDFIPLFQALLYLQKQAVPADRSEICRAAAKLIDAPEDLFNEIKKATTERKRLQRQQVLDLLQKYIQVIEKFSNYINALSL